MIDQQYSHRSNGNPKTQSGRNKANARYDNEPTGEMSEQDLLEEGVSSKEPFDRPMNDYYMDDNYHL